MSESQIHPLDGSQWEVLMDFHDRYIQRFERRIRLLQESTFYTVGYWNLRALPRIAVSLENLCDILGSIVRRVEALQEQLTDIQIEEQEDAETFQRVWGDWNP
ncbi:hypothetical protein N7517_004432 [Penicillium concentricum]|uniref:Uncharacterized protein n=1 Tax=Penicillium concentricum TaxID=293559 RepID=A0A9W9S5J5_9EURO|nr:uncharacterized protein N7517_004432 [Penicillium concentricum]KAJ5372426.1 hypothetical protein N7517_004432 [Penicillium concentricum]